MNEENETTTGECPYCQRETTWLVTLLENEWLRFECTRCCKISRDVLVAQ